MTASDEPLESEPLSLSVPDEFAPDRADKILAKLLPDLSRSRIQALIDAGDITRAGQSLRRRDQLSPGDTLEIVLPTPERLELRPVDIPLDVLYEDEYLVAVNKASGMVTHPGNGTGDDTLVHALLHHCSGQLSGIGGIERPGIVHRLDKETSGVIVVAKEDVTFRRLQQAFAGRSLDKTYLALVRNVPDLAAGSIFEPIGRHATHRTRMTVRHDGRTAHTDWTRAEAFGKRYALLEVDLHTGRTHQIRVHCAWMKHPLAGDGLYGFRQPIDETIQFPRVMLHAWRLSLIHPITDEPLHLEAPLPDDFSATLGELRETFGSDAEA